MILCTKVSLSYTLGEATTSTALAVEFCRGTPSDTEFPRDLARPGAEPPLYSTLMAAQVPITPPDRSPELLAPAGDWECVRAAIENGADAVYFGLEQGFNARARATNFQVGDLPRLMETLHLHGLRGYTTLNTLAFDREFGELEGVARAVAEAGVDAVLVQDVGVARLLRACCPALPLHASTQMTLTSAETIRLAEALGMERVVLARELSIDEIAAIRRGTGLELEVFVHGALCVAYSGQCLTSEALGGRSANRGQCAQACRLPYELVCDGRDVDLGAQRYLLSPQDLAAYDLSRELIAAGVSSFKIEGRLKTPEYVANIVAHYRRAIDAAAGGGRADFTPRDVEEMELSFSRGFSPGWLLGCEHKRLVPATSSAKRGVRLGTVVATSRGRVTVDLAAAVKRGDGIAFDPAGGGDDGAQGGRVYEVFEHGISVTEPVSAGRVDLAFGHGTLDFATILPGQTVWKTDDPVVTQRLRDSFSGDLLRRRQPIDVVATVAEGEARRVEATLGGSSAPATIVTVSSDQPAEPARRHPLTAEILRDQLGRLGGTPFELFGLEARIVGAPMLPLSVIGRLRRELVERLSAAATRAPERTVRAGAVAAVCRTDEPVWRGVILAPPEREPVLHVLCRSLDQVGATIAAGAREIVADFSDIRQYRDAVNIVHGAGGSIRTATPRIHKPGETGIFQLMHKQQPDGVLVRNFAALEFFRENGVAVDADFSLNVTNRLSAAFFRAHGARRIVPAHDLNRDQLGDLVAAVPASVLEPVIHQRMPLFHMEHCVFCAVLSPGTDKTNCGRPCDDHVVKLRDRVGVEHPLTADVGCRNTLFNAVPQSGAEVVPMLLASGVRHLRVELLDEPAAVIGEILAAYRDLLAGSCRGRDVWTRLRALNRVGITQGTLESKRDPLAII